MMALPATVLEAEAVVSTASAGACTLTSGNAAPAVPPAEDHICRQALPRSRGGLRQMARAGQRVRLTSNERRWTIIFRWSAPYLDFAA
jgi:hypothetical protein